MALRCGSLLLASFADTLTRALLMTPSHLKAQSAKARTATLVDELEAKLVEFSEQAKRDLASALASATSTLWQAV